ncbi:YpdA family putative bacillithiol disulfide reductase [Shouchella hunanensis]|uniref:YpdA family putative bacillithiol disulfide reductase n=1 Tax=Shouchella hunanensis TaxID=766894 RepID=A0ABY7W664_9BACI|nr:YpdA family putative bacillithiol disulfide reductase [Shouchella hunanensis]WDF03586.1 YpdA family putative bacillithiol disulfide reductase [Shouchella hunanensis]
MYDVIIIGAGPCGLSAAIECDKKGLSSLIIEKENIVNAIYRYPTHQTFFSTSERLEIGEVPFITEERKPRRNQALVYYRMVAKRKKVNVHAYEEVLDVSKQNNVFTVKTTKQLYKARNVVVATGYYDSPNYMNVPGEASEHVMHYFKEAHPFFDHDVVVIGGKNSAVDAALELEKAGARVTLLYRGDDYSKSVKPWILPEVISLVNNGRIQLEFGAHITKITEKAVHYKQDGQENHAKADFVFAMTGYHPDHSFIRSMGVEVDEATGRPSFQSATMETNVAHLFIAGVIAAGNNANEIFIENGREHGKQIAAAIIQKQKMEEMQ